MYALYADTSKSTITKISQCNTQLFNNNIYNFLYKIASLYKNVNIRSKINVRL